VNTLCAPGRRMGGDRGRFNVGTYGAPGRNRTCCLSVRSRDWVVPGLPCLASIIWTRIQMTAFTSLSDPARPCIA
jgi:hypothetical protein